MFLLVIHALSVLEAHDMCYLNRKRAQLIPFIQLCKSWLRSFFFLTHIVITQSTSTFTLFPYYPHGYGTPHSLQQASKQASYKYINMVCMSCISLLSLAREIHTRMLLAALGGSYSQPNLVLKKASCTIAFIWDGLEQQETLIQCIDSWNLCLIWY